MQFHVILYEKQKNLENLWNKSRFSASYIREKHFNKTKEEKIVRRIRKPFALVLSLVMLVGVFAFMTGCNKDEGSGSGGGSGSGTSSDETPTGTVYVSSFTPIDHEFTNGLEYCIYHDGRFLTACYEVIADNTPEGVTPEWEGEYWDYGYRLYWLDMEGNVEKLEGYQPPSAPEVEGHEDANFSSYAMNMLIAPDGNILTLDDVYVSYYDGPEDLTMDDDAYWQYYVYSDTFYIRTLAQDGSEISCYELSELPIDEDDYFYPSDMAVDNDGNIYITGGSGKMFVLDKEGKLLFEVSSDGIDYFNNVLMLGDGRVAVGYWGESNYELAYLDLETKSIGEGFSVGEYGYNTFTGGGAYDFYYTSGSNFFGYDLETATATKLFNWTNCDIKSASTNNTSVLPDGSVACIVSTWNDDYTKCTCELAVIEEVPAASVPQKTVLSFATQYLDYDMRDRIIDFNKKNTEYRIEVRDYSEYNTEDDYSAGVTKLTTEILSGNVPDIIDMSGLPLERMAAKGLLEDLYPYLDSDSELSRDDFFPNILAAMEVDGGLYYTASCFSISTVIGASSLVGDEPGWTMEEFQEAYAKMPEGCTVFNEYTTRDSILTNMLSYNMDKLVNWVTGECSFDSDTFMDILAFAKSFPSEFDWENYDYSQQEPTASRLQSGKQMLLIMGFYDFEYPQVAQALFGTDITYIGYPTDEGTGNMLNIAGSMLAMSSKSANKDAAWQFLRSFFQYSSRYDWGYPINRNSFNEMLEEAMTPTYQQDENGNYILDENGEKIEQTTSWWYDSLEVVIDALTQEEADQLMELIETTTQVYSYDDTSSEIIQMAVDEAAPYFEGQKSADEVARLVQSKINIFVNEQR